MLFDRSGPGSDYEEILVIQDLPSGLRAILAIHSTRLGPAFGGIRRLRYETEEQGLGDALRLACWMSRKCALAGLPAGGAKMVVLDHPDQDRQQAFRAIGRHIDDLKGRYICGPDVGTTEADLDEVRAETQWVNPKGNDAGRSTARGVLSGLRGTLRALDGDPRFDGRTFLVQGLGAVGGRVAEALSEEGATVLTAEIEPERKVAAKQAGLVSVPADAALSTACDVLVPCALGGLFTKETAKEVQAKAVCGSANDQLVSPEAGRVLHERGILFAPDIVVNSGAVIEGFFTTRDGASDAVRRRAYHHIERIETMVKRVFEESRSREVPPDEIANQLADQRIYKKIGEEVEKEP